MRSYLPFSYTFTENNTWSAWIVAAGLEKLMILQQSARTTIRSTTEGGLSFALNLGFALSRICSCFLDCGYVAEWQPGDLETFVTSKIVGSLLREKRSQI
jgi:hypothetical protein